MKYLAIKTALLVIVSLVATTAFAQQDVKKDDKSYNPNATNDSSKKSIKATAIGKIGKANVTINYHSPGVRKRVIWGGLVPYNDVWVTGTQCHQLSCRQSI